jgi:hypothetical protein
MTVVVVKGSGRYDGEYHLDVENRALNGREWNWIKRISGYMPNTIKEGFQGEDPDLYVALAVVAMAREYRIDRTEGIQVAEALSELPFDGTAITFIFPQSAEDDAPLGLTGEPEQQSPSGSPEKTPSSGSSSKSSSENPAPTPPSTGTSESGTSAPRRLPTLSAS